MDTNVLLDAIIGELGRRLCGRGLAFEVDRSVMAIVRVRKLDWSVFIEFRNNLDAHLSFEYDNSRMCSVFDCCVVPLCDAAFFDRIVKFIDNIIDTV